MRTLLLTALVFLATGSFAQHERDPLSMESRVKAEVSALTESLSLDEKQASEVEQRMLRAEKEASEYRMQCEKAQTQINAIMDRSYASMGEILTNEQSNKLAQMRKNGELSSGCSHGEATKSCADKSGTAKTGACCAGGKAQAAPAETKPAPAKAKNSISAD